VGCYGVHSSGSGLGPITGTCEHGNEPSASISGAPLCEIKRMSLVFK
jgi:hypothetical protein